jgi:uncharacterized membrane protein HdeD (DUF308 family)
METYTKYWIASMIRGVVAIFAAMAVLVMPQMISLVFLLPFAILISMMFLAVYGTVDSAIVLVSSFLVSHHEAGRFALRAQGILGAACGALLFFFVYDQAQLVWFLYLAALQAMVVAITEFTVARGTSVHHGSRWCFVSALIAAISSVALLFGRNFEPQNLAWLLFGYLGVFGFSLCLLSARMLFAERSALRAAPLSEAIPAGA